MITVIESIFYLFDFSSYASQQNTTSGKHDKAESLNILLEYKRRWIKCIALFISNPLLLVPLGPGTMFPLYLPLKGPNNE